MKGRMGGVSTPDTLSRAGAGVWELVGTREINEDAFLHLNTLGSVCLGVESNLFFAVGWIAPITTATAMASWTRHLIGCDSVSTRSSAIIRDTGTTWTRFAGCWMARSGDRLDRWGWENCVGRCDEILQQFYVFLCDGQSHQNVFRAATSSCDTFYLKKIYWSPCWFISRYICCLFKFNIEFIFENELSFILLKS